MIKKSINSLAGKLIISMGALFMVGNMIFGFIFIRYEENNMIKNLVHYAQSTTDVVKRGIFYGMLTVQPEIIEKTIDTIGAGQGIRYVSVYRKDGLVAYSSKKSEVGRRAEIHEMACQLCHRQGVDPSRALAKSKNWTIFTDDKGEKTLKLIIPIENDPSCSSNSSCHVHPRDQKVLGVLETNFSTATVDHAIRKNRMGIIFFGGLYIVTIAISLSIILYKFVAKPISILNDGMRRIGRGEMKHVEEINSSDELGALSRTFNSMVDDVKHYQESLENWTRLLELEVESKTDAIMKAQEQLVNAEKLASLGRMAAGVAHELNSPLTGVITFAHLMKKRTPEEKTQDIEDLDIIIEQAERCSKIIKSLLGFSRKTGAEMIGFDVNELVNGVVTMLRNQAKFHNIRFRLEFSDNIPSISADPNQIQQVCLNMFLNASDAMNEKGEIVVVTRVADHENRKYVEILFTDNGPGIADEHIGKIFEPFFTTKKVGKGTGLGLAVSYGIIKKHGGDIEVMSEAGKGTTFTVRLPVRKGKKEDVQDK